MWRRLGRAVDVSVAPSVLVLISASACGGGGRDAVPRRVIGLARRCGEWLGRRDVSGGGMWQALQYIPVPLDTCYLNPVLDHFARNLARGERGRRFASSPPFHASEGAVCIVSTFHTAPLSGGSVPLLVSRRRRPRADRAAGTDVWRAPRYCSVGVLGGMERREEWVSGARCSGPRRSHSTCTTVADGRVARRSGSRLGEFRAWAQSCMATTPAATPATSRFGRQARVR